MNQTLEQKLFGNLVNLAKKMINDNEVVNDIKVITCIGKLYYLILDKLMKKHMVIEDRELAKKVAGILRFNDDDDEVIETLRNLIYLHYQFKILLKEGRLAC